MYTDTHTHTHCLQTLYTGRALHEIQPSQKIVQETKRDLKRVLGYSDKDEHSPHVVRKTSQMMTGAQSINEPKQSRHGSMYSVDSVCIIQ